jgi:hypothetical protein
MGVARSVTKTAGHGAQPAATDAGTPQMAKGTIGHGEANQRSEAGSLRSSPGGRVESGFGVPALVIIVSTAPAMDEHLRTHASVKHRLPT